MTNMFQPGPGHLHTFKLCYSLDKWTVLFNEYSYGVTCMDFSYLCQQHTVGCHT